MTLRTREPPPMCSFFFNDTATTAIYTLSLHDALPIFRRAREREIPARAELHVADASADLGEIGRLPPRLDEGKDRKSTRLNSSHANISYAVFCLKKKRMLPLSAQYPPSKLTQSP